MSKVYVFNYEMTCEGCANSAKKVLSKVGVDPSEVDADIPGNRITVTTELSSDIILETLKKTGKKCSLISS